jgi:hypothetical protein
MLLPRLGYKDCDFCLRRSLSLCLCGEGSMSWIVPMERTMWQRPKPPTNGHISLEGYPGDGGISWQHDYSLRRNSEPEPSRKATQDSWSSEAVWNHICYSTAELWDTLEHVTAVVAVMIWVPFHFIIFYRFIGIQFTYHNSLTRVQVHGFTTLRVVQPPPQSMRTFLSSQKRKPQVH